MRFFNGAIHASLISTPDSVSSWNTGVIWVGLVLDTCLPGAQRDTTNRFCAKEEMWIWSFPICAWRSCRRAKLLCLIDNGMAEG